MTTVQAPMRVATMGGAAALPASGRAILQNSGQVGNRDGQMPHRDGFMIRGTRSNRFGDNRGHRLLSFTGSRRCHIRGCLFTVSAGRWDDITGFRRPDNSAGRNRLSVFSHDTIHRPGIGCGAVGWWLRRVVGLGW